MNTMNTITTLIRNWRTSTCGALLIIGAAYGLLRGWLNVDAATPWIVAGVGLLTARDASSVDWQALLRQSLAAKMAASKPPVSDTGDDSHTVPAATPSEPETDKEDHPRG